MRPLLQVLGTSLLLVAVCLFLLPLLPYWLWPPPHVFVSMQERSHQDWKLQTGPLIGWTVDFEPLLATCNQGEDNGTCVSRFLLSAVDDDGTTKTFHCETGSESAGTEDWTAAVRAGFHSVNVAVDVVSASTACSRLPITVRLEEFTLGGYSILWLLGLPLVAVFLWLGQGCWRAAGKCSGGSTRQSTA
jgi:hypothetical protein